MAKGSKAWSPKLPAVKGMPAQLGKTTRAGTRNSGSAPISGGTIIPSVKVPKGAKAITTGGSRGTPSKASAGVTPRSPSLPRGTKLG